MCGGICQLSVPKLNSKPKFKKINFYHRNAIPYEGTHICPNLRKRLLMLRAREDDNGNENESNCKSSVDDNWQEN